MNTHLVSGPIQAATSQGSADPKLVLRTVLIALRCWWKIAAPIGVLLSAGAVAAVIRFVDPTYTATAWVLIRERPDYLVSQNAFPQDPGKQLHQPASCRVGSTEHGLGAQRQQGRQPWRD